MHKLALVAWLAVFGAKLADADVIVPDHMRPAPTRPTEPPKTEPTKAGCSSRDALGAEWMFGLAAISLGAWGLRRFAPRRAAVS